MRLSNTFLAVSACSALGSIAQQNPAVPGDNGSPGGIFGPGVSFDFSKILPNLGPLQGLLGGSAQPNATTSANGSTPSQPSIVDALLNAITNGGDLKSLAALFGGAGTESIVGGSLTPEQLNDPGTGPYPAGFLTDPSLPEKTIYVPKTPPPSNVKMPVVLFGEGGCFKTGTFYQPFLIELASHGYVILANGPPNGGPPSKLSDVTKLFTLGQTKISDMYDSMNWALAGNAARFGNVDTDNFITAGQSCGGAEALSAAYENDHVKMAILLNSGSFNNRQLLQTFKYPVAIFNGGPKDILYENGEADYSALPQGLPAYKANLDTGHGGTYFGMNGGKFGKAVGAFLEWQFRNDTKSMDICLDAKAPGSLVSDGWNVTYKNWD